MKILVQGSYYEDPQAETFQQFKDSGRELGKKLAEKGATIFVGSDREIDIDLYIVEGAEAFEGTTTVVVYRTDSWPDFPFLEVKNSLNNVDIVYQRVPDPWERATVHIIEQVDIVVVVGGGRSTLQTALVAPALRTPVIVLSYFPGKAQAVLDEYQADYRNCNMDVQLIESLKRPLDTSDSANDVMEAVEYLCKVNPYRIETPLNLRLGILAIVLLLITAWGALLVSGDSTEGLLSMLIISAMLGTALRSGLRVLQDRVIKLSDILNEFTVGLLLSFSLLLVYLSGGILYEGDVLNLSAENFKRTAVSVSLLALASAFLLEQAAAVVRRRLGEAFQ